MKTTTPKQFRKSKLLFIFSLVFLAAACSKDEEGPVPPMGTNPPIALECDYFLEEARTLVNDPNAPVDYVIDCISRIKNDVIIEPGVVIAFDTDAGMKIEEDGSMIAVGTVENPILFTGLVNERGSWAGISFLSPSVKNELEYVTIEYGGGKQIHSNVDEANLTVSYDTRLDMNHCTLRHSDKYGIYVYGNTQEINIQNSVFTKNAIPVYSYMKPQYLSAWNASNDYTGNDVDRVYLEGSGIISSATWNKINVPYLLLSDLTLFEPNTKLTIQPGVKVFVAPNVDIEADDNTSFHFVGTANEPIIFEGENQIAGSWEGFRLLNAGDSRMEHMVIGYSGKNLTGGLGKGKGAIESGQTILELHYIYFHDIFSCAIVGDSSVNMSNITGDNINIGGADTNDCLF